MRIPEFFESMLFFKISRSSSLGVILSFFILKSSCLCGQIGYQDSLRNVIATTSLNEQKLNALVLLGLERNSLNADSLSRYASEARKLAISLHDDEALLDAILMQGHVLNKRGESNAVIALVEKELVKNYSTPGLRHRQRKFYLLKGFILNVINKPKEAQETFFAVLAKAENEADFYMQAAALNGIGWSFQNLNNLRDALDWYKKGITLLQSINLNKRSNKELLAVLHSNIGLAYYPLYKNTGNKKFADSASLYLDSAINTSRQQGFTGILAISLGTKALLIHDTGKNIAQAETMLVEAVRIRKKLGQLYFIIADLTKLADIYNQAHNYQESIAVCKEAIKLADSSGIKSDIIVLYEILARSFRGSGQFKDYGDVLAEQIRIQDSINQANTTLVLSELNTKYEVQKKEILIAKQQYDLLRRKIIMYIIIISTLAFLALAFLKFRKLQKQQKERLASIEKEEKMRIELQRKQAREKERERITADLHDDMGATLSSMHIYSDLATAAWETQPQQSKEMVNKISAQAKELMAGMGDIVWSLKSPEEEKNSFTLRLKNYSQDFLAGKGIAVNFAIDEIVAKQIVNPLARKNILLIAKEAINNIAKYSGATEVVISLQQEEEQVVLTISDNGNGFNKEIETGGNGLGNIKQRCIQLQGSFSIAGTVEQGTTLSCRFPIATISHIG